MTGKRAPRISVICTVRNEAKTIESLARSILAQTIGPGEFIVVDGGSTDGTLEALRNAFGKRVRIIVRPGANIAAGRNIAIRASKFPWIASIDGGCIAEPDWLEKLAKQFPKADIVSGAYLPIARNSFERIEGKIVCKNPGALWQSYMPSSRSVAFKKSAWAAVGGYPEKTYTAEDTLFNHKLKEAGFRFRVANDAIVHWRMRPTLKSFARQFYLYGLGDGRTGLVWKYTHDFRIFGKERKIRLNLLLFLFVVLSCLGAVLGHVWSFGLLFLFLLLESFNSGRDDLFNFLLYFLLTTVKRAAYCVGVLAGLVSRNKQN
jgi:glycosyltransferase involved in cell wall biosynthesis